MAVETKHVVIIGAGIIGCALAFRLTAHHSCQVTVIDSADAVASSASGASFGWINASFASLLILLELDKVQLVVQFQ